jgi:putative membrane protein
MTVRAYRTFQGLVLAALSLYLFSRIWNGTVLLYINQRFVWLVVFAAVGLLILSQFMLQNRSVTQDGDDHSDDQHDQHGPHCQHDHHCQDDHDHGTVSGWNLWWLALPVLLGLLVPARPLGTSALATRGITTNAPIAARGSSSIALDLPAAERSVLDWNRTINYASDPYQFNGDPADVIGFVYHDSRLEEGQFLVGRFTITCCVADAFAIGMVVHWPDADTLPDNSWVRVQGPIEVMEVDGQRSASIRAVSVEKIPEPAQPYLYP